MVRKKLRADTFLFILYKLRHAINDTVLSYNLVEFTQ